MLEGLELLGYDVQDKVTRFRGIVSSISFDLYGCVQAIVTPPMDKDGKLPENHWFDVKRLMKMSAGPVMEVPSFVKVPGGQDLPRYPSLPRK